MKSLRLLQLGLAIAGVTAFSSFAVANDGAASAVANDSAKGQLIEVTSKDAAWVAKQKATYPTNVCLVSGDKLKGDDDTDKPVDYIFREAGKPDRLVTFCCHDCVKDFNKDPQKYLKALDEAAAHAH